MRRRRPGNTLSPNVIRKFSMPLTIPSAMPKTGSTAQADSYTIAVRQFEQQMLPAPHQRTPVWGYGPVGDARWDGLNPAPVRR